MKNKNDSRIQILLRMISKSNQMGDDISKLMMQIYSTQSNMNTYLDNNLPLPPVRNGYSESNPSFEINVQIN